MTSAGPRQAPTNSAPGSTQPNRPVLQSNRSKKQEPAEEEEKEEAGEDNIDFDEEELEMLGSNQFGDEDGPKLTNQQMVLEIMKRNQQQQERDQARLEAEYDENEEFEEDEEDQDPEADDRPSGPRFYEPDAPALMDFATKYVERQERQMRVMDDRVPREEFIRANPHHRRTLETYEENATATDLRNQLYTVDDIKYMLNQLNEHDDDKLDNLHRTLGPAVEHDPEDGMTYNVQQMFHDLEHQFLTQLADIDKLDEDQLTALANDDDDLTVLAPNLNEYSMKLLRWLVFDEKIEIQQVAEGEEATEEAPAEAAAEAPEDDIDMGPPDVSDLTDDPEGLFEQMYSSVAAPPTPENAHLTSAQFKELGDNEFDFWNNLTETERDWHAVGEDLLDVSEINHFDDPRLWRLQRFIMQREMLMMTTDTSVSHVEVDDPVSLEDLYEEYSREEIAEEEWAMYNPDMQRAAHNRDNYGNLIALKTELGSGMRQNEMPFLMPVDDAYRHSQEEEVKTYRRVEERPPPFVTDGDVSELSDMAQETIYALNTFDPEKWSHRELASTWGLSTGTIRSICRIKAMEHYRRSQGTLYQDFLPEDDGGVDVPGWHYIGHPFLYSLREFRERFVGDFESIRERADDDAFWRRFMKYKVPPRKDTNHPADAMPVDLHLPVQRPPRYRLVYSDISTKGENLVMRVRERDGTLRHPTQQELIRAIQIENPWHKDRQRSIGSQYW